MDPNSVIGVRERFGLTGKIKQLIKVIFLLQQFLIFVRKMKKIDWPNRARES